MGYERYRKEVQKKNISFTVLGHEECDMCKLQSMHAKTCDRTNVVKCGTCDEYEEHMKRAREGRSEYRKDADREWAENEVVNSADLIKISLIPILPHKVAVFTPRLIAFNETFAPLEKQGEKRANRQKPLALLWHEATAGRDTEDTAANYWAFLRQHRGKNKVTLFVDNCSAQNKSWVLITVLLTFVQQAANVTNVITLKFLEPGHTSMNADAAHQLVQKKLSKAKEVSDFRDFTDLVETSGMQVKVLEHPDFYQFEDGVSKTKLNLLGREGLRPYLRTARVIRVKRGSHKVFSKTAHSDNQWRAFDLLKSTYDPAAAPDKRSEPRGINQNKIDRVCQSLVPLIVPHMRQFWLQLQEKQRGKSKSVRDLTG